MFSLALPSTIHGTAVIAEAEPGAVDSVFTRSVDSSGHHRVATETTAFLGKIAAIRRLDFAKNTAAGLHPRLVDRKTVMVNIAFICHSYHKKTRSPQFIIDLLLPHSRIDIFYDESWNNVPPEWARNFNREKYDIIIIHQMHEAFSQLRGSHPNVVFIPMFDAMMCGNQLYWRPEFNQAKVLCFSWHLRQEVMVHNPAVAMFHFFPDPSHYQPVTDYRGLRGFFWYRVKEIDPPMIFNLCRAHNFEKFIIHNAPDPGTGCRPLSEWSPYGKAIEISTWAQSPEDYKATLERCNVFFAPRPREGIGMSFLEAMASGMCVAAPYAATMNEYVSNGMNGLLYQLDRECALNFERVRDMGLR